MTQHSDETATLTVREAGERIRARNRILRAFVSTRLDDALVESDAREKEPARSPLHGLPYSLKDTWDTAGILSTAGSHRYRARVPERSSNVHLAFDAAGAVLVGKTNCSDLALAAESSSWVGGECANPRDLLRTSGGSSGGAAAAVADGLVAFDWGSDIGGSIRMPAAFCGVYGMRLSSETWPMHGEFPVPPPSLRWMNGQGPITSSLARMREMLDVTAPRIRTGTDRPFRLRGAYLYEPDRPAAGQWPTFARDVAPVLRRTILPVRDDHGLPPPTVLRDLYGGLWASHFEDLLGSDTLTLTEGIGAALSAVLLRGRFGDRRIHPHTAQLLLLIALGRITWYRHREPVLRRVRAFQDTVASLWDRGFLLVAPTCTFPAPRHGRTILNWHLQSMTFPGNLVDATVLAVPFGRFGDGLPRSVQIMGPPGSERTVLEIGERLVHTRSP